MKRRSTSTLGWQGPRGPSGGARGKTCPFSAIKSFTGSLQEDLFTFLDNKLTPITIIYTWPLGGGFLYLSPYLTVLPLANYTLGS